MKPKMARHEFKILQGGCIAGDPNNQLNYTEPASSLATLQFDIETLSFDKILSQYYHLKSIEQDLDATAPLTKDAPTSERIAEYLLEMPSTEPRHVLLKLKLLDDELSSDMDCAMPVGRKHMMAFAALKADIITLLAELG